MKLCVFSEAHSIGIVLYFWTERRLLEPSGHPSPHATSLFSTMLCIFDSVYNVSARRSTAVGSRPSWQHGPAFTAPGSSFFPSTPHARDMERLHHQSQWTLCSVAGDIFLGEFIYFSALYFHCPHCLRASFQSQYEKNLPLRHTKRGLSNKKERKIDNKTQCCTYIWQQHKPMYILLGFLIRTPDPQNPRE